MDGEIIGAGLADGRRHDLDDPEDRGDFGHLVEHACASPAMLRHGDISAEVV